MCTPFQCWKEEYRRRRHCHSSCCHEHSRCHCKEREYHVKCRCFYSKCRSCSCEDHY